MVKSITSIETYGLRAGRYIKLTDKEVKMSSKFSIEQHDKLFEAVLKLSDVEACRKFFEDICTVKEIEAMSQRLEVAKCLMQGMGYQEISSTCGASTATISRVNKCLLYGAGGYSIVVGTEEEN